MKKTLLSLSVFLLIGTTQLSAFGLSDVTNAMSQNTSTPQATSSQASGLTEMLSKQLNISDKQASGGVGSILNYAKSALTSNKFQTLKSAIPNAQSLMSMVPKGNSTSGGLSSLTNAMGGNSISKMAGLASQFSSLGLNSGMISKFVPIIMQYFKSSNKTEAGNILSSLF